MRWRRRTRTPLPWTLSRGQVRVVGALMIVTFIAGPVSNLVWDRVGHAQALWTAAALSLITVGGAMLLSASIARHNGLSFWTVLFLRRPHSDRDEPDRSPTVGPERP